jgi:hypothetical protein
LNPAFPWLSWQSIAAAARTNGGSARWADFGTFLEENQVANDGALPIEDLEAGSIEPALQLFKKVNETIGIVHEGLYERFPNHRGRLTWAWKRGAINTSGLLYSAAANFTQRRGLFGQGEVILYGATTEGGSAYWSIAVAVPRGETASSLIAGAEALPDTWERSTSRPQTLRKLARVADHREPEAAARWFEEGFKELADCGLMARLFAGAPDPSLAGDEDSATVTAPATTPIDQGRV